MKKYISKMIVGVFCAVMLLVASTSYAADAVKATNAPVAVQTVKTTNVVSSEAWVFSLGGAGVTSTKGKTETAFGADISIGRTGHLLLPLEAGLRQGIGYSTPNGGTVLLDTKVYSDWTVFSFKKLDIFAGGNAGATYGNTPLTWTVAPEAGLRYWVKQDVAVVGRVDYPFNIAEARNEHTVRSFVGLQVKF